MRREFSAFLAALCTWAVMPAYAVESSPKPAPDCRLKQYASLDLDISPTEGIRVPVSINGTDVWMTLNLVAGFSLIAEPAAKTLKLRRRQISSGSIVANGSRLTYAGRIDTLKLGGLVYKNAAMALGPFNSTGASPGTLDRPTVGFLGLDVFAQADFELNLAAKKLQIFSHDHCPGSVVYWTRNYTAMPFSKSEDGSLYFPLELDGKQVEATLSTGIATSSIDSNITRTLYGFDENSPGISKEPFAGDKDVAGYRAMALTAPGLNILNTRMQLARCNPMCGHATRTINAVLAVGYADCPAQFPLHLGQNILSKLRIYVATKERMIYISRDDAS